MRHQIYLLSKGDDRPDDWCATMNINAINCLLLCIKSTPQ